MTDDIDETPPAPAHWAEHKNWALLHEQLEQIEDAAATAKTIALTNKPGIGQLSKVLRELSSLIGRTFLLAADVPGYVPAQRTASARAKVVAAVDLAEKMDVDIGPDVKVVVDPNVKDPSLSGEVVIFTDPPTKKSKPPVDMQGRLILKGDLDVAMNWDLAHPDHKARGEIVTECPHCEKETAP